ncbi:hypothetical protein BTVI_142767 [Pitangus sulphuratus]|nr:hypothetical protein BTVI_142767 [Pitangus sulphuratus]
MGDSVFSERPALRYAWVCQQETVQEPTGSMYIQINHNVFLYSDLEYLKMDSERVLYEILNSCTSQSVHMVPEQPGGAEKIIPVAGSLEGLLVDGMEQRSVYLFFSCFTFSG